MPYKLPMTINDEQDLKAFENYLSDDIKQFSKTKSEISLKSSLKAQIGQFVLLETVFGLRKGKLLEVGSDFVGISCNNPKNQMLISFSKINSFILLRGN